MSDTRLRELERRWKETGSPDDEAAYLLERVRVGDLTQERLELAAYCGHEGARRAYGCEPSASPDSENWLGGLADRGKEVRVRSAWTCAQLVLASCELGQFRLCAEQVTALLGEWLNRPSDVAIEQELRTLGAHLSSQEPPVSTFEYAAGAAWSHNPHSAWWSSAIQATCRLVGMPATVTAVRGALSSWALGTPGS